VIRADTKGEAGKSGRARECVSALGGVASGQVLVLGSAHNDMRRKVAYYEAPGTCL
jgi:hypothetical protein